MKGHKKGCVCCICKNVRGELKGKNHPLYGRRGSDSPLYGKRGWSFGLTKETDERIAKRSENTKGNSACGGWLNKKFSEEHKRHLSESKKRYLSNPENLAKNIKNWVRCAQFNNFEKAVSIVIGELHGDDLKFVGNRKFFINGKCPDFISEQNKIVILCHGVYWHLKKKGLAITKENKRAIEEQDKLHYKNAGYEAIIVWEDEFYSKLELFNISNDVKDAAKELIS